MVDRTDIQAWQLVDLTLKDIATGAIQVVSFVNRPELDSVDDTTWPLLMDVSGCGVRMSDYLPQSVGGQVTIDNSPGSLGFERRFSDLLQRYTLVDQPISIWTATTAMDDYSPTTWTLVCRGVMQNCTASPEDGTLRINLGAKLWDARSAVKQVTSTDFADAPDSSLGNYLPLIIGTTEVQPLRITADDDHAPKWGYATTLADTHPITGIQAYYTKDAYGDWVDITTASATNVAVHSNAPTTAATGIADIECAAYLATGADSYLITHVYIGCKGMSWGASGTGSMTVRIYEANQGKNLEPLSPPIAQAEALGADYTSFIQGSANYDVELPLSKPCVLRADSVYWISVAQQNDDPDSDASFNLRLPSSAAAIPLAVKGAPATSTTFTTSDGWSVYANGVTYTTKFNITWGVYGVVLTDTPQAATNGEGFGHSYFMAQQASAIGSAVNPSLDSLPWVLSVSGLEDDAGGTITGTPSTLLTNPAHVVRALLRTYDGADWVDDLFSESNFSATWAAIDSSSDALYRTVAGATRGAATLGQLLGDICRSGQARIGLIQSEDTPLGVWVYGTTESAVATITDETAIIKRIDWAGPETVVNRIRARADWQLITADATRHASQGSLNDWAASIMRGSDTDAMATWLCADSVAAYGEHYLADETFSFTPSGDSLEHVTEILLRKFCKPHLYVELETPLIGHETIDLFDIINIVHPALPSYYGTSAAAKLPTYAGTEVDVLQGQYFKRADLYRAQVEGRSVEFDRNGFPVLKLTCRILDNAKDLT